MAPAGGLGPALRGFQALLRARAASAAVSSGGDARNGDAAGGESPSRIVLVLRAVPPTAAEVEAASRDLIRDVADAAAVSGLSLRIAALRPAAVADLATIGAAGAVSFAGAARQGGRVVGMTAVELELSAAARSIWGGSVGEILSDLERQVRL